MTDEQKKFIIENHDKMTRQDMAKRLNVSITYLTNEAIKLTGKKNGEGRKPRKEPVGQKEGYFYHDETLATI